MSLGLLKSFDVAGADVTVWVVKKSGGTKGAPPIFTARWVDTDDKINAALKSSVESARKEIGEVIDYDLLAQNNESSALLIDVNETHAPLLIIACDNAAKGRKAINKKELLNSDFYVICLVKDGKKLLCVKKTDSSWKTKSSVGIFKAIFSDEVLTLDERPNFALSSYVDMFIFDKEIFICNKRVFESVLNYKKAHIDDFTALKSEAEFVAIFSATQPIIDFVGDNKINLRRMSAIKEKAYYKDQNFIKRLISQAAKLKLNIQFDADGKIVPTPDTCRDILQALLDHRLTSQLSNTVYDVEHVIAV